MPTTLAKFKILLVVAEFGWNNAAGDHYEVYVSGNKLTFDEANHECLVDGVQQVDLQSDEQMAVSGIDRF